MKKPYEECPSFNVCSAPKCPLDPDISLRNKLSGEDKCTAQKPTRIRIGLKHPQLLQFKGLTKREYNGMKAHQTLERYLDRIKGT